MQMLKVVQTIQGAFNADYHGKEPSAGVQIRLVRNTYIQPVDSLQEMDLNPKREPGDPVSSVKIPTELIARYLWVERGIVKRTSFQTQMVAVTDDGEVVDRVFDGDMDQSNYRDNYSDAQSTPIVADRLSQDSTDMESSIDASAVIERNVETADLDKSLINDMTSNRSDNPEQKLQDQLNQSPR